MPKKISDETKTRLEQVGKKGKASAEPEGETHDQAVKRCKMAPSNIFTLSPGVKEGITLQLCDHRYEVKEIISTHVGYVMARVKDLGPLKTLSGGTGFAS